MIAFNIANLILLINKNTIIIGISHRGIWRQLKVPSNIKIKAKALKLGAKEALIVDAKKDFAENYLSWAIKANADYQGGYHLFCPLGRAIISKIAVEVAHQKGIDVIAHGCTGKGNDQVRFEGYITTLDPQMKTLAPVREWSMGRDEQLAYAKKHQIEVPHTLNKLYSYDENL